MNDFGKRVQQLRKANRLTQQELADRVAARLSGPGGRGRFDVSYLSKIENGRMPPPSSEAILALAAELDADSDELLALAKKAPPDIGEKFKESKGARMFFRSAVNMKLSEAEWNRLLAELKKKRRKDE